MAYPLWQQMQTKKKAVSPMMGTKELDINGGYDDYFTTGPDLSYDIVGTRPEEIQGGPISYLPEPIDNTQLPLQVDNTPTSLNLPDMSGIDINSNWFQDLLNKAGTTVSDYFSNPAAFPAIATAIQQWNNANKYGDMASGAAEKYNPFGQYRRGYGDQLQALYADPSSIENTPGYKFRLSQGMGVIGPKQAAMHGGYGNEFRAMQDYAQGLASTEWGNEVDRLSKLAGANIDGSTAAQMEMNGLNAQVAAQNGALQALATPFGQNTGDDRQGVTINNNNGGGSGSGNGSGYKYDPSNIPSNAQNLARLASQGDTQSMYQISQLAQQGVGWARSFLFDISGGAATDQNIIDLNGINGDLGFSGDPYNPDPVDVPEWIDQSGFNQGAGDFNFTTDPQIIDDINNFFDFGGG